MDTYDTAVPASDLDLEPRLVEMLGTHRKKAWESVGANTRGEMGCSPEGLDLLGRMLCYDHQVGGLVGRVGWGRPQDLVMEACIERWECMFLFPRESMIGESIWGNSRALYRSTFSRDRSYWLRVPF